MTESEFTILSFINDGLNYPYIIEKVIESKSLRYYFELSFSSIYFLINQLEKEGLIKSYSSLGKKGVSKKGVKITDKGKLELKKAGEEKFSGRPILSHPLDYILLNCYNISEAEIKSGLNRYIKEAERISAFYNQKKEEFDESETDNLGEKLVLSHFLSRLKCEIEWAKETKTYLSSIKNLDQYLQNEKERVENYYRNLILED